MSITRRLRRVAAVTLLAALPIMTAPAAVGAEQTDRTVVVADPGWGVVEAGDPPAELMTDPGWG
ncbi:hypothetical protein [Streptomyces sp. NPDC096095]|uniref:hypothetical protein n=1 Tax=Streptomyces sp. NPDC096095 TaxID=3155545 RepID=UPI003325303A